MKRPSLFQSVLWFINLIFAGLLLTASILPYLSLAKFPVISLLSLMVPLWMLANLVFMVYWILRKKRKWFVSFLVLGIAYVVFGSFYETGNKVAEAAGEDFTIMSFNARAFNKYGWADNPGLGDDIVDFIAEQDPDVVCFQEFEIVRAARFSQYPYQYVNTFFPNDLKVVQAILSKTPILKRGSLDFPHSHNNATFADIVFREDTIRIYNVHLESLRTSPTASSIAKEPSGKLFKRLGRAFSKQEEQARLLDAHMAATPIRKIVCGDLNNTQFSNVYQIIKGDLTDTFDKQGTGYGSTYNLEYFPARIDFILADPAFEIKSHRVFKVNLSDHLPIMASMSLDHK